MTAWSRLKLTRHSRLDMSRTLAATLLELTRLRMKVRCAQVIEDVMQGIANSVTVLLYKACRITMHCWLGRLNCFRGILTARSKHGDSIVCTYIGINLHVFNVDQD